MTTTCRGTLGAAAALRGAEVFAPQSLGLMPCKPAQDPDSGLGQPIQACDCRLSLPWALPVWAARGLSKAEQTASPWAADSGSADSEVKYLTEKTEADFDNGLFKFDGT